MANNPDGSLVFLRRCRRSTAQEIPAVMACSSLSVAGTAWLFGMLPSTPAELEIGLA